jgi:hypothetical protein
MPDIYGIKTTARAPVHEADVDGVPFEAWRNALVAECIKIARTDKDVVQAVQTEAWGRMGPPCRIDIEVVQNALGVTHPIYTSLHRSYESRLKSRTAPRILDYRVKNVLLQEAIAVAQKEWDATWSRYPMLSIVGYTNDQTKLVDYIKLVDQHTQLKQELACPVS